jgi:hypothetical protein
LLFVVDDVATITDGDGDGVTVGGGEAICFEVVTLLLLLLLILRRFDEALELLLELAIGIGTTVNVFETELF